MVAFGRRRRGRRRTHGYQDSGPRLRDSRISGQRAAFVVGIDGYLDSGLRWLRHPHAISGQRSMGSGAPALSLPARTSGYGDLDNNGLARIPDIWTGVAASVSVSSVGRTRGWGSVVKERSDWRGSRNGFVEPPSIAAHGWLSDGREGSCAIARARGARRRRASLRPGNGAATYLFLAVAQALRLGGAARIDVWASSANHVWAVRDDG